MRAQMLGWRWWRRAGSSQPLSLGTSPPAALGGGRHVARCRVEAKRGGGDGSGGGGGGGGSVWCHFFNSIGAGFRTAPIKLR